MKKMFLLVGALCSFTFSVYARADAELRLYNGRFEFDLKQTITIALPSGQLSIQNYKKVCTAFEGCKAVPTDMLEGVAGVEGEDLNALRSAIVDFDANSKWLDVRALKPSICDFYSRFVYRFKAIAGDAIQVAEFQDCTGRRLNSARAETIERVLNVAATNAGL